MRKQKSTSFFLSPIINISGFASLLWSDAPPETLRKRLYQKAVLRTLSDSEKKQVIEHLEKLLEEAKKELE
jgi:hypothetical protein